MTMLMDFLAPRGLLESLFAETGMARLDHGWRHFPDGESLFRIDGDCTDEELVIVADLSHPDHKIVPLLLLADTLRDLGAASIGLTAPYLPYMRQDVRFVPGEAITARYFPQILQRPFDWLVTVDPHLHRIASLDEIYSIPTAIVSASEPVAAWLKSNSDGAVLIGPDEESRQWVEAIANQAGLPFSVMRKQRHGDRDVSVECPEDLYQFSDRQPVLIDDMISTGQTIIEAARQLSASGFGKPACVCVHGLFADDIRELLEHCSQVVSCNSVPAPTQPAIEQIDLGPAIAEALSGR